MWYMCVRVAQNATLAIARVTAIKYIKISHTHESSRRLLDSCGTSRRMPVSCFI
jgi:hypothetical protein